jgi:hypothetical protein
MKLNYSFPYAHPVKCFVIVARKSIMNNYKVTTAEKAKRIHHREGKSKCRLVGVREARDRDCTQDAT